MSESSPLPPERTVSERRTETGPAGAAGRGEGEDRPPEPAKPGRLDRAGLAACLARPAEAGWTRGDVDLNADMRPPAVLRPAAVLVPLVDHGDHWSLVLTQRTVHLSAHAGQISFPGGGREPRDSDSRATALRETEEEIGLAPDSIEVIGRLDTYVTRTGFEVEPVVGVLTPPLRFVTDPFEVAEVFEVPLDYFLGDGVPEIHSLRVAGRDRFYYVFPYGERYIWGATAGMLVNLRQVLLAGR